MSGTKFDSNKPDLSLIPYCAEVAEAEALMIGEKKYGRYNFEDGHKASQLAAAIKRHLGKWMNGEERDPDGQHHLGAIKANCSMLLRQIELGTLVDDRTKNKTTKPEPIYTPSPRWSINPDGTVDIVEPDKTPDNFLTPNIDWKATQELWTKYPEKYDLDWQRRKDSYEDIDLTKVQDHIETNYSPLTNSKEMHDNLNGPCKCGAWHKNK